MDVFYFTEMPYAEFPESEAEKFPSMRLTFPNTYFDPNTGQRTDEPLSRRSTSTPRKWDFDGLMINEHHNTPSCMDVEVNITGGILARITNRARILMLGNMLPTSDNPVRLAEGDRSAGRNFRWPYYLRIRARHRNRVVGANNTNPIHNRERFEECHDLVVKNLDDARAISGGRAITTTTGPSTRGCCQYRNHIRRYGCREPAAPRPSSGRPAVATPTPPF